MLIVNVNIRGSLCHIWFVFLSSLISSHYLCQNQKRRGGKGAVLWYSARLSRCVSYHSVCLCSLPLALSLSNVYRMVETQTSVLLACASSSLCFPASFSFSNHLTISHSFPSLPIPIPIPPAAWLLISVDPSNWWLSLSITLGNQNTCITRRSAAHSLRGPYAAGGMSISLISLSLSLVIRFIDLFVMCQTSLSGDYGQELWKVYDFYLSILELFFRFFPRAPHLWTIWYFAFRNNCVIHLRQSENRPQT